MIVLKKLVKKLVESQSEEKTKSYMSFHAKLKGAMPNLYNHIEHETASYHRHQSCCQNLL